MLRRQKNRSARHDGGEVACSAAAGTSCRRGESQLKVASGVEDRVVDDLKTRRGLGAGIHDCSGKSWGLTMGAEDARVDMQAFHVVHPWYKFVTRYAVDYTQPPQERTFLDDEPLIFPAARSYPGRSAP